MKMWKLAYTSVLIIGLAGCSSKQPKVESDTSVNSGPAMKGSGNANAATTSESELLERYDLVELNSVASALRLVFEKGTEKGTEKATDANPEEPKEPVLDCAFTADQAKKLMNPLKALMETQTERERESYSQDPSVYARSHGLETCGAKCACGALASVLKPVSVKSFKTPAQKVAHERFVKRLQAKASRQTAEETFACARKVNWFCNSDLRSYLEKQSDKAGL